TLGISCSPTIHDLDVAPFNPAELLKPLQERSYPALSFPIICCERRQHTDMPQSAVLLRSRRERPCRRRAAEKCDELAPPHHSITSSAIASRVGGKVKPNALAVLRLITNSNLNDCMIGKSAGF